MRINSLLSGIALSLLALSAKAANIDTNMAKMQAMDKITGRVSEIDVPVGGEAQFGSFSIVVRRCVTRTPEETPENTAFVDVADTYNSEEPINIFKGWMMSSTPALNAVEHPIYDVWLLQCYDGDLKGKKLLSENELSERDNLPMREKPIIQKKTAFEETETKADETTENETVSEEIIKEEPKKEVVSIVVGAATTDKEDGAPEALFNVHETIVIENDSNEDNFVDEENAFADEDVEIIEVEEE